MTYIWCGVDRWCYLFNVLDIFSREWIAYAFSTNAGRENAILAVVKAVEKHLEASGKVRLWSDNGSQYISRAFEESVSALRLEHKFIAYHKPEDDPYIESFHGKLKREYVWTRDFQTFQEAEQAIAEAFIDYNRDRPHSSLGYLSPYEFLARMGVMHTK
jgi:putative transposase